VHSITTSGLMSPSLKLTVIDSISLTQSELTAKTRRTHGESRMKTTSSLLQGATEDFVWNRLQ